MSTSSASSALSVATHAAPLAATAHASLRRGLPQPGDLVFYRSRGTIGDRLIVAWTGPGDAVHVEVVGKDPRYSFGALRSGVERHLIPLGGFVVATADLLDAQRLKDGLAWLEMQRGNGYGFGDLGNDFINGLAQRVFHRRVPLLVDPRRLDCSDLATRFLDHAGYPLGDDLIDAPTLVSPNSLGRALGVIPSR